MQVVMVMFRADGERRSFSLTRDLTVIGRREDCDLRIPLGDVSRKHCRVVRSGDTVSIEDLGSSNGTFVNGQRISETVVAPGDTIQVGPVVFCVQIDGVPAEEDMAPIFSAPPEPAYEQDIPAEPMETVEEGVEPVMQAAADEDAELEAFEPIDEEAGEPAEPELPAAEAPAEEEAVEVVEDMFVEDETTAAQSELIAQPLDSLEPMPTDDAASNAEEGEEVALEDFEIVEGEEPPANPEEGTRSGEPHIDTNRH
jgi:predicted component of type VI protein secretion system